MHYVPASFRAPLASDSPDSREAADDPLAASAIPVYLLTAAVGLLLGAEFLIDFINDPTWTPYRSLFGFRLSLLAAVLGGSRILYHTLEGLFEGRIGADLALTIACLAAIVLGEPSVAALVVFIALCGETIEGFVSGRARRAVESLFALRPRIVHRLTDGQEQDVPLTEIRVGDLVVVRPGERVPVDGTVIRGRSSVDQSALTGESWPIDKEEGDEVLTGTLNQFGSLTVSVDRIGGDTTFGQIVQMVAEATARKTPLERTADRLARYFLPVVLVAAAMTLIGWRIQSGTWSSGWMPALAVLVVACPCPLILATPSAVLAAMAWLARKGVYIKGSVVLERLAEVETFAFDKTGTLTRGALTLGDILTFDDYPAEEVLRIAGGAERPSEHLLARLVVTEAEARNLVLPEVVEFTAQPGAGVTAKMRPTALPSHFSDVENHRDHPSQDSLVSVVIGNRRLLESQQIEIPDEIDDRLAALDVAGQTPLLVAVAGRLVGAIGVRDSARSNAREALGDLRAAGVRQIAVLTGDRLHPARQVVQGLGPIDHLGTELLPLDKARWIENEIRNSRKVAMVGDGINDAPALAAATVGIALGGTGSQIAAEAGDIVLMGDPLAPLPGLLRLSRELVNVIRQSIYLFAFGLNGVGVVLSAWGLLSPVGAAIFHEAASLAVMLNALRLLWFERWDESRVGRFVTGSLDVAERVANALSPSRAAVGLVRHWSTLLRIGAAIAAFIWCLSNLVLVTEDEQAVVTRFGRLETKLTAGLHLRWPPPFERVVRERVGKIRAVQLGFRAEGAMDSPNGTYTAPIEWQAEHQEEEVTPIPEEALMLSGEEVPVELTAEVQYRIRDLPQFLYGSAEVDGPLRAAAERTLRTLAARLTLDEILTAQRSEIEALSLARVQQFADEYKLGIEVLAVNLLDIHPPTPVVPNYRQVADALEEREQLINEAQTTYARELLSVAGETAVTVLEQSAIGDAGPGREPKAGESARAARWTLTDELWKQLTIEKEGRTLLSGAAASRLLAAKQEHVRNIQAATGEAARFQSLLEAYRGNNPLTLFHLYWNALEEALRASALTILDPEAGGRKHLFLGNGEPFESRFPALLPQSTPNAEDQE